MVVCMKPCLFSCMLLVVTAAAAAVEVLSEAAACSATGLTEAQANELEDLVTSNDSEYLLIAIPNMRCTGAAKTKLASCGIQYVEKLIKPADIDRTWNNFAGTGDANWRYMDCRSVVGLFVCLYGVKSLVVDTTRKLVE